MAKDNEKAMTFEEIEAHIKKTDFAQFVKPKAGDAYGAQQDLTGQLQNICGIYKGVRPILQGIIVFPLIPASIKNAIKTFMQVMDTICP